MSNNGAQVCHTDSIATGQNTDFWNSAHRNGNDNACSAALIASQGGAGRIYCFAKN